MANTGKELEAFVREVESVFLPHGFKISSNDKVFDKEGKHIAEFDVVISGRLGTTEINWLIECRDRPSGGAAPVGWIEQLFGRRDRFNFNKVTAVSTTGFSPGAKEYAVSKGIELRSVKDIRPDTMLSWFNAEHLIHNKIFANLKHVRLIIPRLPKELKKPLPGKQITNKNILTHTTEDKMFNLFDAWSNSMVQIPNIDKDIEPNKAPKTKIFPVKFINPESRYVINLQGKDFQIEGAIFHVDVSIVRDLIPISKITQYTIEQQRQDPLAESVHFELNDGFRDLDIAIHRVSNQDQTKILISRTELEKLDSPSEGN